ncbi:MAG: transglycosylase SLT domain-containing protein [Rhodoferax sp.]|nr:transglycosylase SLT domain-containing protein [Rhodoferax sp.]
MNVIKLCSLCALALLTACTTTPPSSSSAAAGDGPGITLRPSHEMGTRSQPANRPEASSAYGSHPPLAPINAQLTSSRTVVPLAAPVDLWDRIRRGYAMPDLDSDLVRDREQWYATRPDYIFRMTERSKKYLFHIVEELELRNMPTELALLPFIESAFNPQAVSGAKAAGMWQFMPATGKYFELKQNAFRDDRRDVLASTRAALDYLQKLHGMFGDWHLALAAYNWGEGSVGRAIAKNQRAGLPLGYPDLNMPMETRLYVPKLQAVKNIVGRPELFNSKLPVIENHPYFQSVTIRRDIDVALAARLAEVPLEDFKALNPSINRPVIMAAGTPQVLLPWDNAEVFQSNLESYGGGRLASWTVWVAPTTMRPADAAKRVGMSEAEFRAVNAIPPRVVIKAGSSLLVPRSNTMSQDVTVKVADNGQLSLAPEVVLKRTLVKAGKGESVASIARKYRVNADQVAQWNKVGMSANFKPGQQVVVFLAPAPSKRSNTGTRSASRKVVPNRGAAKGRAPATRVAKR